MGCSSCGGKTTKAPIARPEKYFVGEKGFVEIRYIGWESPYWIFGEYQRYEFDNENRNKLIDTRDEEILLSVIVDGVKVFDRA